jgi:hypothetical protein
VRAICAVTGLPWSTAHDALCVLSGELFDMPSTNRVWWTFLRGIGFEQMLLPNVCPDCYTVEDFARDHPKGKYVLGPYEHAVAVIDGDWWDTWDSGKTVPMYYFEYGGKYDDEPANVLPTELPAHDDAAADAAADEIG